MTETRDYNTEYEKYAYWLNCVSGVGSKTTAYLTKRFGSAKEVYRARESELKAVLPEQTADALCQSRRQWKVEKEYELLAARGIRFYPIDHPHYPKRLRALPDAPSALYCIGELPPEERPSAAVIGARNCSAYGSFMAKQVARILAQAGVSIVSGMAMGIDGLAQRAALEAGGQTYAVLGSGVLVCYPKQNRPIYEAMQERGGVISEYSPYTRPKAGLFPARNRIISGLAEALIVIEAKEKSGTCITVDMALEQGREVYAVPGRIGDALSAGCNRMIEQGAGIVTAPERLPKQLFGLTGPRDEAAAQGKGIPSNLPSGQRSIWEALDATPISLAALYENLKRQNRNADLDMTELRAQLLEMTLAGCVRTVGGSYFQRLLP